MDSYTVRSSNLRVRHLQLLVSISTSEMHHWMWQQPHCDYENILTIVKYHQRLLSPLASLVSGIMEPFTSSLTRLSKNLCNLNILRVEKFHITVFYFSILLAIDRMSHAALKST